MTQSPAEGAETLSAEQIKSWRYEIQNATHWTPFARKQLDTLCDMALRAEKAERELAIAQSDIGWAHFDATIGEEIEKREAAESEVTRLSLELAGAKKELAGALQYGQMYEDAARERNAAEAQLAEAKRDAERKQIALLKVREEIELFAEWTCTPTYGYRDECVRPAVRKSLRIIDSAMQSDRAQEGSK